RARISTGVNLIQYPLGMVLNLDNKQIDFGDIAVYGAGVVRVLDNKHVFIDVGAQLFYMWINKYVEGLSERLEGNKHGGMVAISIGQKTSKTDISKTEEKGKLWESWARNAEKSIDVVYTYVLTKVPPSGVKPVLGADGKPVTDDFNVPKFVPDKTTDENIIVHNLVFSINLTAGKWIIRPKGSFGWGEGFSTELEQRKFNTSKDLDANPATQDYTSKQCGYNQKIDLMHSMDLEFVRPLKLGKSEKGKERVLIMPGLGVDYLKYKSKQENLDITKKNVNARFFFKIGFEF
ncbi:MAG: hypothetical protein KKA19_00505, partial [Candidatus Margulisbacteria bacterium]|nr:hypothetical protein [Candidatus Margulisiibacteriota bacterium]